VLQLLYSIFNWFCIVGVELVPGEAFFQEVL